MKRTVALSASDMLLQRRLQQRVIATAVRAVHPETSPKSSSGRLSGNRGRTAEAFASWEAVEATYGRSLAAAARHVSTRTSASSLAARRFLWWLPVGGHPRSKLLIQVLSGLEVRDVTAAQVSQMLLSALKDWTAHLASIEGLRPLTVARHGRSMATTLEQLGNALDHPLLRFQRRTMTMKTTMSVSYSLGYLNWPETEGLSGAARERRCLDVVRTAAMREFDRYETLFLFGQAVLAANAPPNVVDKQSWTAVKTLITVEDRFWSSEGRSQFRHSGDCPDDVTVLTKLLTDRATWIAAGLPPEAAEMFVWTPAIGYPARTLLARLAMSCLGATTRATWSAMISFCCATGWNQQPIISLPVNPFLVSTETEHGLATRAFVSSYKKRSHHGVLAYLDSDLSPSLLVKEDARAVWQATVQDFDRTGRQDGYATLQKARDADLLRLLARYRVMTDPVRRYCASANQENFFVYIARTGVNVQKPVSIVEMKFSGPLGRTGLTFQAIRKSFVSLAFRDLNTAAAAQAIAGHRSSSVLIPHYLNSDDVKLEMDQAIRLFQNILQGLMMQDRNDESVFLGMPDETMRWFQELGTVSGIAAATGRLPAADLGPSAETVRFDPSYDNLRDLFLMHRSLRQMQGRIIKRRWMVQGLPMLAAIKAIGKVLHSKGLGTSYLIAARRARQELALGIVALPPLLEA